MAVNDASKDTLADGR